MSFVSDIISSAANIGMGMYNARQTERINERNIREARAAEEREREYNKPINQMARLKEAGLNPNLIYGSGASTGTLNSQYSESSAPQINASVKANPLDVMREIQELRNSKQTGENLANQGRLTAAQARIAEHDADVISGRPGVKSDESALNSVARDVVGPIKEKGQQALDMVRDWLSLYRQGRSRGFSVWKAAGLPTSGNGWF